LINKLHCVSIQYDDKFKFNVYQLYIKCAVNKLKSVSTTYCI